MQKAGRITAAMLELQEALKQNRIDRQVIYNFLDRQRPGPDMLLLTASSTGIIVSEVGLLQNGAIKTSLTSDWQKKTPKSAS